jgi:hypothetical protein
MTSLFGGCRVSHPTACPFAALGSPSSRQGRIGPPPRWWVSLRFTHPTRSVVGLRDEPDYWGFVGWLLRMAARRLCVGDPFWGRPTFAPVPDVAMSHRRPSAGHVTGVRPLKEQRSPCSGVSGRAWKGSPTLGWSGSGTSPTRGGGVPGSCTCQDSGQVRDLTPTQWQKPTDLVYPWSELLQLPCS